MVLSTISPWSDVVHLEWLDSTAADAAATVAADHLRSQAAPGAGAPALSHASMARAVGPATGEPAARQTGAEGRHRSAPGEVAAFFSSQRSSSATG